MAVNYSTALKTTRMQMMVDTVDTKTLNASTGAGATGDLVIGTSSLSGGTGVLVTIPLANPSFTVASGVATLAGVPLSANASASGTAAKAEIRNDAGTVVVGGLTVGTSGSDINLSSVSITSGQTVTITATSTITHSP